MEKIELIATDINFTFHSIVYTVKQNSKIKRSGVVCCANDISNKDLILKPTLVDKTNSKVVFTPTRVIPHFYQGILAETIRDVDEYRVALQDIYKVGEVVGYILV
jgi:hypothetical protein